MIFTIPAQAVFGVSATTTVDPNVGYLAGSLQAVVSAKAPFANLNSSGAVDTVSTADTVIDATTVATGNQS